MKLWQRPYSKGRRTVLPSRYVVGTDALRKQREARVLIKTDDQLKLVRKLGGFPCYLYAARSDGFVKFGITNEPQKRLSGLKTGNPHGVEMLGFVAASTEVEKQVHAYLSKENHSGEWFRWEARPVACAMLIAAKDLDGLLELIEYKPPENILGIATTHNRTRLAEYRHHRWDEMNPV